MASTFTPAGIELIADGEQSNTWGQTTNENWELMEEMVAGVTSVALTSTTYTLTITNGATSTGRHAVIVFTGSPGGTCTVTVDPSDMQKVYFVKNDSSESVIMTQGSGGDVTIAAGSTQIVYCDGADAAAKVATVSGSEFDTLKATNFYLGGTQITATAAELNTMDGVTATYSEINTLDGFTGNSDDLNYAKDLRATGVSAAEFNILDGLTATTEELNKLDGVTASTTELNVLDGITASTTELNYCDGVTSNIQTQLNSISMSDAYPVGSIYMNASVSTNPATLFGFGTWVSFGAGRVLVGVDSGDSSFNSLGETGGSKNAIVVSHSHNDTFAISTRQLRGTFKTDDQSFGTGVFTRTTLSQNSSTGSECCASTISMNADHNHSITGSVSTEGSSGTNANLQPYITVYMWKRTA